VLNVFVGARVEGGGVFFIIIDGVFGGLIRGGDFGIIILFLSFDESSRVIELLFNRGRCF
jgi:hypothetical protein